MARQKILTNNLKGKKNACKERDKIKRSLRNPNIYLEDSSNVPEWRKYDWMPGNHAKPEPVDDGRRIHSLSCKNCS